MKAFATNLLDEVDRGGRWTWEDKAVAYTLAACVVAIGLALVLVGGLVANIPLIVIAALLSSAALAGTVLRFRRQTWRIAARQVQPLIDRAGI